MKNIKDKQFDDLRQESIKTITKSRIYKNFFYGKILHLCCSPHKGCNKIPVSKKRSWKFYRENQYKQRNEL